MSILNVGDIIKIKDSEIVSVVDSFIERSKNIRKGIIDSDKIDLCMTALLRDTYLYNMLYSYSGMMQLISENKLLWDKIDNKLIKYQREFLNDNDIYYKIVEIKDYYEDKINITGKDSIDYITFLNRFINKFHIKSNIENIDQSIQTVENRIRNLIHVYPTLKIPIDVIDKIPEGIDTKNSKIELSLNEDIYLYLLDNVPDMDTRHKIEDVYLSRTENICTDLAKLIELRKIYSNLNNFTTYFRYKNRGKYDNTDTIKYLITELNNKIDKKSFSELDKIHRYFNSNGNNQKLRLSDVIRYNRIHKNNVKFKVDVVLDVLFKKMDNLFGIKISKINIKKWRDSIQTYICVDNKDGHLLGRLYIDMEKSENKIINSPISIKLTDKMQIDNNTTSVSEIAVIGNYDLTENSMSYHDISMLFREFGYVLQNLSYKSRVGLLNYDDEFSNFVPQLLEYIAFDRETVLEIVERSDEDISIIDHIKMSRNLDMCISLKLRCINAKFDHLIHNSEPILNIISNMSKKRGPIGDVIFKVYKEVYLEIMAPLKGILDIDIKYFDPITIVQQTSDSHSVQYGNLMNEIFAYATYYIIKNNKTKGDFRKDVLEDPLEQYRVLVRNFLSSLDQREDNAFNLYVRDIIKYQNVEDITTEDTNYFDDRESDSESDVDGVININRDSSVKIIPKQINMEKQITWTSR